MAWLSDFILFLALFAFLRSAVAKSKASIAKIVSRAFED
jgi:hypothetical protein